jgi:hypothetical protein
MAVFSSSTRFAAPSVTFVSLPIHDPPPMTLWPSAESPGADNNNHNNGAPKLVKVPVP